MNRVIRWNDIERESLPRLFSYIQKKNFNTRAVPLVHASSAPRTRVQYPSHTRALSLVHWCTTPRTLEYYPSDTSVRGSRVRRCIKSVPYLQRQHAYYGTLQSAAQRADLHHPVPSGEHQVCNQQQEVIVRSNARNRISWDDYKFGPDEHKSSW